MTIYQKRRERVYEWMSREGIRLVMLEDVGLRRNSALRWLSGHPNDALLFLSVNRRSFLLPWDDNLAMLYADIDTIVPYREFELSPIKALRGVLGRIKTPQGSRIEIPETTSYPRFLKFVEEFSDFDIICHEVGISAELERYMAVKDEDEIKIIRKTAAITNDIINLVEKNIKAGKLKTEADVAHFIDAESRKQGCEGTGFETIAAGPARSFAIHAFPAYTGEAFTGKGLSILDFGLKYAGYTSDVCLTFVKSPLSKAQEKMLSLVEKAYKLALSLVKNGAVARDISQAVDTFFGRHKYFMPHSLGHGIGLKAHEAPSLRNQPDNNWVLESGMVLCIEPGLYDPIQGGCRLENMVLVTDTGPEVLTDSRIIHL